MTLATLPVKPSYWKPGFLSVDAKPCPIRATCANGSTPNAHYDTASNATCAPGRGVAGVYCLLCADRGHYFDADLASCRPCAEETAKVLLFVSGLIALICVMALVARHHDRVRAMCVTTCHTLELTARRMSLTTKLKISISYYQIITQIDRVYAIVYPPAYAKVVAALNSVFHAFFGWIPGVATECTGLNLEHELLLVCFTPLIIVLVAALVVMLRRQPLTAALPFALIASFLCFPFVASRGFRALAPCDCFSYTDGGAVCFLRDAYAVQCIRQPTGEYTVGAGIRMAAWIAILLYACAVPLLYASLLLISRKALIGESPPTALSRALQFLSKDYHPRAFAWELVEVVRKITVTGFLALVKPGSLLQLYLGVAVSLCILILQMYADPYVTASDSFLSAVSASALVLTLLASLGIQLTELTPELSALGVELTGLDGSAFTAIVAVLIGSALLVLCSALAMFLHGLFVAQRQPIARWATDLTPVIPRILSRGAYHAFVSHQWGTGQVRCMP